MTEPAHHGAAQRLRKDVGVLTAVGGSAFWLVNLAISRTSVAADYRAALSIEYLPMLVEAAVGGLAVALGVSYGLLRLGPAVPGRTTVRKAAVLSLLALVLVTLLVEVPAKFLTPTPHALRYFLVGLAFNVLRISALGLVIGRAARSIDRRTGRPGADAGSGLTGRATVPGSDHH